MQQTTPAKGLAAKVAERIQQEEKEDNASLSGSLMGSEGIDFANDMEGSRAATTRQLNRIEKKIQCKNLSKKDRRLLQNRKSALKCRLKKQDQFTSLHQKVDSLAEDNAKLREHVSKIL